VRKSLYKQEEKRKSRKGNGYDISFEPAKKNGLPEIAGKSLEGVGRTVGNDLAGTCKSAWGREEISEEQGV